MTIIDKDVATSQLRTNCLSFGNILNSKETGETKKGKRINNSGCLFPRENNCWGKSSEVK
jgi:hypothetical protein